MEILPIDDSLVEPDETVVLRLILPPAGVPAPYAIYKIGTPAEATVTIHDNDAPRDTNQQPKVAILSPTNGTIFPSPADIRIFANPTDADGLVQTL